MSLPRRLSLRLAFLWSLFGLAALATGFAVYRLHRTAQEEIAAQRDHTLTQESTRVGARAQVLADETFRTIAAKLASLHVDGLAATLRQWDEATPVVLDTFLLDPAQPPTAGSVAHDRFVAWQQFSTWRDAHPAATNCDLTRVGTFAFAADRTVDNPGLPTSTLGYQEENLDILTHDGRPADPWAARLVLPALPDSTWVFLYQTGPGEPVRGCLYDPAPLLAQLRAEFADSTIARFELLPASTAPNKAIAVASFPAHRLLAQPGLVFLEKENNARFNALMIAALIALFLAVGLLLTAYTRREALVAGRKITFVTQVSHELRTPLTSIRMFADMLGEPGLTDAKRVKFAQTIGAESSRLHALIERLLAFNAQERNPRPIRCVPFDVTAVVAEITGDLGPTLLKSGLQVVNRLPAGPILVLSDHSTLKQALINLLDNAVKYGGATFDLTLASAGDMILLRVADDGPGVPRDIRARLFEPFVQGGQQLTDKPSGLGLGLSLSRSLLRQAGADLVLVDTDRGATFEIRLPKTL